MEGLLAEFEKNPPKRANTVMDTLLFYVWEKKEDVAIYLIHGIRLVGRVVNFDSCAIVLLEKGKSQVINRQAISSVMQKPKEDVNHPPRKL